MQSIVMNVLVLHRCGSRHISKRLSQLYKKNENIPKLYGLIRLGVVTPLCKIEMKSLVNPLLLQMYSGKPSQAEAIFTLWVPMSLRKYKYKNISVNSTPKHTLIIK